MGKPTVKLKNWLVLGGCLYGEAEGHPNLPNGLIKTSKIIKIETKNTIYEVQNWVPKLEAAETKMITKEDQPPKSHDL